MVIYVITQQTNNCLCVASWCQRLESVWRAASVVLRCVAVVCVHPNHTPRRAIVWLSCRRQSIVRDRRGAW